ncbi:MAG TPA: hypothetical protein VLG12_05415 [Candidatus Saccharimonadales bacterium]|nr:hypothetical protein [Candidatus Saccharimonadales bacterium]
MGYIEWEFRQQQEHTFSLLLPQQQETVLKEFGLFGIPDAYLRYYKLYEEITDKSKNLLGPTLVEAMGEVQLRIQFMPRDVGKDAHCIGAALTCSAINQTENMRNYLGQITNDDINLLFTQADSIAQARISKSPDEEIKKIAYPIVPDSYLWQITQKAAKTLPLRIPSATSEVFNIIDVNTGAALMYQLLTRIKERGINIQTANDV